MASTYTPLGVELMATGENAGTWGTKTNVGLQILEQIAGGYTTQAMSDGGTVTLTASDGSTGATCATAVIKLTGALTGTSTVTVPDDITGMKYLVLNGTSGGQSVVFKTVSGTGVTWATTDAKLMWHDGTNIVDSGLNAVTASSTTTFTNKTLTSPKIVTSILDTNGLELALITATGSAVNEFTIANAATGGDPTLSVTGDDANVDLNLLAKGTGVVQSNGAAVKVAGKETIWVPSQAMYPTTTAGCADLEQTELTAGQPELKSLDFDPSTEENAQFAVAFPKSWDPSQLLMYQVFWTADSTNTGDCIWGCKGVAAANDDPIDVAFGTAILITDAYSGTANDLTVTAQSASMTVAGTPAADEEVFFNIYRDADAAGDTFTGDAKLLGVKIYFATNLPNDA